MSLDRRTLLRERLAAAGLKSAAPKQAPIPRRSNPARACLSPAQRHTWHYEQAHPGALSNSLGLLLTFDGAIEESRLAKAMERVVECHQILRTTYHQDSDGTPFQRIHPQLPFACSIARTSPAEALARAQASLAKPFDLERMSPLRLLIFRTAPDQVMVALIVHHILWDGATFDLLSNALAQAYAKPHRALPEPAFQVADLAEWQSQQPVAGLEVWTDLLAAPRPALTLCPTPPQGNFGPEAGGRVDRRLTSAAALKSLAAAHKVTPFIAFMACWAAILGRSGQPEVMVGTTVLDRDIPGSEQVLGNLANPIALRLPVGPKAQSKALIAATDAAFDRAFTHRSTPYEAALGAREGRDLCDPRQPPALFDSLIVFIPGGTGGPSLPGVTTSWQRLHNQATQFPLVPLGLEVFVRGQGAATTIDLEATYARARFGAEQVEQLLAELDHTIHLAAEEAW
jgi:hypothetical protein